MKRDLPAFFQNLWRSLPPMRTPESTNHSRDSVGRSVEFKIRKSKFGLRGGKFQGLKLLACQIPTPWQRRNIISRSRLFFIDHGISFMFDWLFQTQAQTPQQRKANALYAKRESAKRGKPLAETKKGEVKKAPISKYWIGMSEILGCLILAALLFVLVGGTIFELVRMFF